MLTFYITFQQEKILKLSLSNNEHDQGQNINHDE